MQRANGINFEVRGVGEPVLTIHGGIIADSFAPLMDEPALNDYRIIRYRRRGYGGSDPTADPPTIVEHAQDALALLQHLGVSQAHVIAHSGGGSVAVQAAVDAPNLVRSLVLLEPALQSATPGVLVAVMRVPRAGRLARGGGTIVLDDFTPSDDAQDECRRYWLDHAALHATELLLTPTLSTIVARCTR